MNEPFFVKFVGQHWVSYDSQTEESLWNLVAEFSDGKVYKSSQGKRVRDLFDYDFSAWKEVKEEASVDRRLLGRLMSGGCTHSVWATSVAGITVVEMANDDDPHFVQTFRSREELESFIDELDRAASEAWSR